MPIYSKINDLIMNLIQIYEYVGGLAKGMTNVNQYTEGDIYENWNATEIKYSVINCAVESVEDYDTHKVYNAVLYYGDRLVENRSNRWQIQTEGVRILGNIVRYFKNTDGMDTDGIVEYRVFEQKFADWLAGAWCRVRIMVSADICADE